MYNLQNVVSGYIFKTRPGPVAKNATLSLLAGNRTRRIWSDALPTELRRPLPRACSRTQFMYGGKAEEYKDISSRIWWHLHSINSYVKKCPNTRNFPLS